MIYIYKYLVSQKDEIIQQVRVEALTPHTHAHTHTHTHKGTCVLDRWERHGTCHTIASSTHLCTPTQSRPFPRPPTLSLSLLPPLPLSLSSLPHSLPPPLSLALSRALSSVSVYVPLSLLPPFLSPGLSPSYPFNIWKYAEACIQALLQLIYIYYICKWRK